MASAAAAAAHLRRATAAAARRHHPPAAVGSSRCASAVQKPAATPLGRTASSIHRAAGTRNTCRALCHQAYVPVTDPHLLRLPPEIRRELFRIELAGISLDREMAKQFAQLTTTVNKHHSVEMVNGVEAAMRIGRISWRVSTTVLTVTIGAGFGLVQFAKPGWEAGYEVSTSKLIIAKMDSIAEELESSLVKTIKDNSAVAAANAFLKERNQKEVALREAEITAMEAELALWEADISRRESK